MKLAESKKTKLPEMNEELAYATLDHIREHPEEWNQATYFCRTTACFGGRAIILARDKKADRSWRPSRQARHVLGWTEREADSVFYLLTSDFGVLEAAVKRVLSGELRQ
jgi:hypothetical protein